MSRHRMRARRRLYAGIMRGEPGSRNAMLRRAVRGLNHRTPIAALLDAIEARDPSTRWVPVPSGGKTEALLTMAAALKAEDGRDVLWITPRGTVRL